MRPPAAAWLIALMFAVLAPGCASVGGGAPASLDVTIEGAPRLNPDEDGQSLPTVVRVYQLRSTGKLDAAEFDALYRSDKAVLGEDLLQVDELTVSPGERVHRSLPRAAEARAVAAVAVVRRPFGAAWRAAVELTPGRKPPPLRFVVEDYRIQRR